MLHARTRRTYQAALASLFGLSGVSREDLEASTVRYEAYLAGLGRVERYFFWGLLFVLEYYPLAVMRNLRTTFSRLAFADQEKFLEILDRSRYYPNRVIIRILKLAAAMGYFTDRARLARMGFVPHRVGGAPRGPEGDGAGGPGGSGTGASGPPPGVVP
ncbi:MAG: hypothetical protein AAB215_01855 [Planctomycetota bacterium]